VRRYIKAGVLGSGSRDSSSGGNREIVCRVDGKRSTARGKAWQILGARHVIQRFSSARYF